MLKVLITMLIAGTIFTILGSILAILLKKENTKITSFFLAFASGSMLSIVFVDLFPELQEINKEIHFGIIWILLIIIGFYLLIFFLHMLTEHHKHHHHSRYNHDCHVDEAHQICHDRAHAYQFVEKMEEHHDKKHLIRSGLILFLAMCIHNFPEGISLGVSFSLKDTSGYALAILIGMHNIVVGFSMAMPFLHAKMKHKNILLISFLSSIPLILGAICGFIFGNINEVALLLMLSFSIGAILYVVFTELLPQAFYLTKSKYIFLFLILGILVGGLILII